MRKAGLLPFFLLLVACGSGGGGGSVSARPGHGAIAVQVNPNPIVATPAGGDMYDFPFEVVVRETGGRPVDIQRVSAQVFALGGIRVAEETYDAARITSLGYSTRIPANGELRYRFSPRKSVPDERLFGGVSAELRVEARDDTGTPATASITVTVTR